MYGSRNQAPASTGSGHTGAMDQGTSSWPAQNDTSAEPGLRASELQDRARDSPGSATTAVSFRREKNTPSTRGPPSHHPATRGITPMAQGDSSTPPPVFAGDPPQSGSGGGGASTSSATRNATAPLAVRLPAPPEGTDDQAIVASAQVSATEAIPAAGVMSPRTLLDGGIHRAGSRGVRGEVRRASGRGIFRGVRGR